MKKGNVHLILNVEQQHALKTLKSLSEITIKASDKGGNVVLMNNLNYEKMCLKILKQQTMLLQNFTSCCWFNNDFYRLVGVFFSRGIIIKDLWDFVRTQHPRQPTMYALPKVHKNVLDPLRRPIISRNGSISEGVSQVIDQYLRPHVLDLPSYTKDTIHLLQMLEDLTIPSESNPSHHRCRVPL